MPTSKEPTIIDALRMFFTISLAALECNKAINAALGGVPLSSKMLELHRKAKDEIHKENPDMELIDNLLAEMEQLANKANDKL